MSASIELRGIEEIQRRLNALSGPEMKTAIRNTLNDTAYDAMRKVEQATVSIFDRPTPTVTKGFWVKRASKENLVSEVRIKDVKGTPSHPQPLTALEPHIPGHPSTRALKGMERALISAGLMRPGQYLMPSRTMKLDRYGNVPGSTASKMLNDIGAFRDRSGFTSTTRGPRVKYIWGTVRARGGGTVTGIWLQSGFRAATGTALQMVVVNKTPRYRKIFDFQRIGLEAGRRVIGQHAAKAVDFVLRRQRTAA